MRIPCEPSQKWYLTEPNERGDSTHGSLLVGVVSAVGGVTGTVGVALQLDWDVEFEGTDIESTSNRAHIIYPDLGYENLFTTSDGSFDATVLTFKMHAGGSMVPFSSAEPHMVYTTEGTSSKVYYYDSAEKRQECKYFARAQSAPGLLLFASKELAAAYVRTGDLSQALKYYKASEYATPLRPGFKEVSVSEILHQVDVEKLELLRPLTTLVSNSELTSLVAELRRMIMERPKGTLEDPIKVFSEDPVRLLADAMASGPSGGR